MNSFLMNYCLQIHSIALEPISSIWVNYQDKYIAYGLLSFSILVLIAMISNLSQGIRFVSNNLVSDFSFSLLSSIFDSLL